MRFVDATSGTCVLQGPPGREAAGCELADAQRRPEQCPFREVHAPPLEPVEVQHVRGAHGDDGRTHVPGLRYDAVDIGKRERPVAAAAHPPWPEAQVVRRDPAQAGADRRVGAHTRRQAHARRTQGLQLVGIDHAFSFPLRYFDKYGLERNWPSFLDDFQRHWPTDEDNVYVDFVREGVVGDGAARQGSSKWRRLTDGRAPGAKSVFHFDAPGSVAKSTHAGLPWLRAIRQRLGAQVHFWPFDGWSVPEGLSAVVEAYPALHNRLYPLEGRTSHQHDAFSVAAWMADMDRSGRLDRFFRPELTEAEREVAGVEGWIFGA